MPRHDAIVMPLTLEVLGWHSDGNMDFCIQTVRFVPVATAHAYYSPQLDAVQFHGVI